jgi:hypothetical protein
MKYIRFLTACFILLFAALNVNAQDVGGVIYPYGTTLPTDPSLKNLEWNRYTSHDDIVIMSIDNEKGKWMSQNIEKIRSWALTRWGFPETKFAKECRIFCVPNKELLKKLFNLDSPKYEIRNNVNVLWIVLEESPEKNIPQFFTPICFSEFESRNNIKIAWWFNRGASLLNSSMPEIRSSILSLNDKIKKDEPIFISQKMFTMTEQDYLKENLENRKIFDNQAAALCLMLRKEFGEAKLQGFLRMSNKNDPQDILNFVYGFHGYENFDKQYIRFMRDLTSDVTKNKTPDSYLTIKQVR